MKTDPQTITTVLVTDCGSTTTKALLFECQKGKWRQTYRGEAPTTVEEPVADVTIGATNAFREIEEISGRKIINEKAGKNSPHPFIITTTDQSEGIDLYLSTSSAGGGLQMIVGGIVKTITTESAQRAALGAGAIVLDCISADDGRDEQTITKKIRHLKPDIMLLAGGVDGGSSKHVIELAEIILAASPRPRFGNTLKLPLVYAGNKEAVNDVKDILENIADIEVVENIRPTLEQENLKPAREAIHDLFLHHVMSHSPGYGKLLKWTPVPVMPTPSAVGDIVETYSKKHRVQVLCADIGGATTDIFSVFNNKNNEPVFNRTVSANLGMSYSIANVIVEAGTKSIARWLPFAIEQDELKGRLMNKMIRPSTIPQTKEDLWIEQAVCREALRLSLEHHRSLAVGLSGAQKQRGISDLFNQSSNRFELVDMLKLDVVIGSGGVLSHAPHRLESALMMIDGFGMKGLTQITVDSIFMMPHLGVFSTVSANGASEIFEHDCLVNIAHAIVPVYPTASIETDLAEIFIDGKSVAKIVKDDIEVIQVSQQQIELKIVPASKTINVGSGAGVELVKRINVGAHGLILDGRNKPIVHDVEEKQAERQMNIYKKLGIA